MKIKGFDKNLRCRGFQFEVGKTYEIDLAGRKPELCTDTVFHFCDSIQKVHYFYSCGGDNRFCEIEPLGEIVKDNEKCGSNKIRIVREVVGDELNLLLGKINGNAGLFNTGYYNTGYYNTGYYNTGYYNTGDRNTGYYNTGNCNTGDRNTGYYNTGDCNTGSRNTGDRNTGNRNTGYYNTGNCNTGDCNTGNRNTGDWNSCDYSSGFFCTKEPKAKVFNQDLDMTVGEFRRSKFYDALFSAPFKLTEWINYSAEEIEADKDKELIGGYLKSYTYKEACANWWAKTTAKNKEIIKSIPHFDSEIFEEITGVKL